MSKRLPNGVYCKADVKNNRGKRAKAPVESTVLQFGRARRLPGEEEKTVELNVAIMKKDGVIDGIAHSQGPFKECVQRHAESVAEAVSFKSIVVVKLAANRNELDQEKAYQLAESHLAKWVHWSECRATPIRQERSEKWSSDEGYWTISGLTPDTLDSLMHLHGRRWWLSEVHEQGTALPSTGSAKHVIRKKGKPRPKWHSKRTGCKGYYNAPPTEADYMPKVSGVHNGFVSH